MPFCRARIHAAGNRSLHDNRVSAKAPVLRLIDECRAFVEDRKAKGG